MDSAEKQRILVAYERAVLVAALANRGFYVIGEVWRGRMCGRPARPWAVASPEAYSGDGQPRPGKRDSDPGAEDTRATP